MDMLIFTAALLLCGLGTWALAKRRETSKRQAAAGGRDTVAWALLICALGTWGLSLYLMHFIMPGLQASFAWLGTLGLSATLTVFALPWLAKDAR